MSHSVHKFWLKITAVVIGSFGPIFFLGTMWPTSEPARWTLDLLSWPLDGAQNFASPDTRFLSALTGGFLLGWGVTIWLLSTWVYDLAPEAVRRAVLIGMLSWFVLDSAGSIASGTASNAAINILVLLLAVGPLWRRARDAKSAVLQPSHPAQ
jgi:biotin transporter BioY